MSDLAVFLHSSLCCSRMTQLLDHDFRSYQQQHWNISIPLGISMMVAIEWHARLITTSQAFSPLLLLLGVVATALSQGLKWTGPEHLLCLLKRMPGRRDHTRLLQLCSPAPDRRRTAVHSLIVSCVSSATASCATGDQRRCRQVDGWCCEIAPWHSFTMLILRGLLRHTSRHISRNVILTENIKEHSQCAHHPLHRQIPMHPIALLLLLLSIATTT